MNLSKKTKAQLLDIIVERDDAITNLKNRIDTLVKHRDELDKQYSHLVKDMDGTIESLNDMKVQQAHEIQNLRTNLKIRGDEYLSLKSQYDELVYENGVNRSDAGKYKLTTIAFIILFIIALICACI